MKAKTLKFAAVLICTALGIVSFGGCKEIEITEKEAVFATDNTDTVTLEQITFYPGSYNVYVIDEQNITHYDFSSYWVNARDGYDYFSDPLPPEGEYGVRVFPVGENGWEDIIKVLNEQGFDELPENLDTEDIIDDGWFCDIEVKTDNERYFSGGYCADIGKPDKHQKFSEIMKTIYSIISKQSALYGED